MTTGLTALTEFAVTLFRTSLATGSGATSVPSSILPSDPALAALYQHDLYGVIEGDDFKELVQHVFEDPELTPLAHRDDEPDPFILSRGGGSRLQEATAVLALLGSARGKMTLLDLDANEETYARLVIEEFQELKRVARGESVRVLEVIGYSGVSLPAGTQARTPWGILRPNPMVSSQPRPFLDGYHRPASALLVSQQLLTVSRSSASARLAPTGPNHATTASDSLRNRKQA